MIFQRLDYQLTALFDVLKELTDAQYTAKIPHLRNATIGEHTRHILEILHCLQKGYQTGEVDYVNRKRNLEIQANRTIAIDFLRTLLHENQQPDKNLNLVTESADVSEKVTVASTYGREIVYQTEHVVHHLALIQVALIEQQIQITPADFGVAQSTTLYKMSIQNNQLQN